VRHAPSNDAVQVADYSVRVAEGGTYRAHLVNFGAKLSRTELHIAVEGEGAEASVNGVAVLSGTHHSDVTTHVDHVVGNTKSSQLFKYVAGGCARTIYQGKVTVRPGANGSDSRQTAKGLLLSDRAEIENLVRTAEIASWRGALFNLALYLTFLSILLLGIGAVVLEVHGPSAR